MVKKTFVIIDADYKVRNSLSRVLSQRGYVIPMDSLEESGSLPCEDAFLFISDHNRDAEITGKKLRGSGVYLPAIAYSASPPIDRVVQCLRASCSGYLDWPNDEEQVWSTIDVVAKTSADDINRMATEGRARRKLAQLTPRERQVALGIGTGLTSKELAKPLGINFRTVELHRANILMKLELRNMAGLIRTVVEAGELTEATSAETEGEDELPFPPSAVNGASLRPPVRDSVIGGELHDLGEFPQRLDAYVKRVQPRHPTSHHDRIIG